MVVAVMVAHRLHPLRWRRAVRINPPAAYLARHAVIACQRTILILAKAVGPGLRRRLSVQTSRKLLPYTLAKSHLTGRYTSGYLRLLPGTRTTFTFSSSSARYSKAAYRRHFAL